MQKFFIFIKRFIDFFRRHGASDRSLMDKLRDKYRLVIMNDDTFEEVTSMKLTPLSVYVTVSMLVVGTAILVTFLIVWTPLKRYIPGYGDFSREEQIGALASKVSSLDKEFIAKEFYIKNLQKILNGDLEDITKEAVEKQGKNVQSQDTVHHEVDRIPEDETLRATVARGSFSAPLQPISSLKNVVGNEMPLERIVFTPPVSGEVVSAFDMPKSHFGIDIAAPKNTAVRAAADGVVIFAGYTVETGYSITIQHLNNLVTLYKHNSVLLKKEGSIVKAGEAIAIIGNSGERSSGPHLHFELWHKGRAVDPGNVINFN